MHECTLLIREGNLELMRSGRVNLFEPEGD